MPDEDLDSPELDEFDEVEETPEPQPAPAHSADERLKRKNAELLAENKALRARERERLLSQYPDLTGDDLQGLPTTRVEALLAKVARRPVEASQMPVEASPAPPAAQVAAASNFVAHSTAAVSAGAAETLSALEAHQKYSSGEWDKTQYHAYMQRKYSQ